MPGLIHPIAATNWSLGGSMLTFAFPMVLFIVAALVLFRLLWWPHRIPGHSDIVPSRIEPPDLGTAHRMAAAAGMTTVAGAGAPPLQHEPHGATGVAQPTGTDGAAQPDASGPEGAE